MSHCGFSIFRVVGVPCYGIFRPLQCSLCGNFKVQKWCGAYRQYDAILNLGWMLLEITSNAFQDYLPPYPCIDNTLFLAIKQLPITPAFSPSLESLSWVSLFTKLREYLLMALRMGKRR
jgi:hypothetical protein